MCIAHLEELSIRRIEELLQVTSKPLEVSDFTDICQTWQTKVKSPLRYVKDL